MDNYIRIYQDVISDDKCQYFIDKFESYPQFHRIQNTGNNKTLTNINLMNTGDQTNPFKEDSKNIVNSLLNCVELYKKDLGIKPEHWPPKFGIEDIKLKKYLPNTTDEFPDHADSLTKESSGRFLVMFLYLTDNDQGQTTFRTKGSNVAISCRKGTALIFPPFFPWVHAGRAPVKVPKYLLGTYLSYI